MVTCISQGLGCPMYPRFPDTNFFNLLEKLMAIKSTPAHILVMSVLTDCYIPYLTKTVEPLYYNTAEKLLNYFVTNKNKYPKT